MTNADVSIEHTDLDPPAEHDGDDPTTSVYVTIETADGMRYTASTNRDGDVSPRELAEQLLRAARGAAWAHSPVAGGCLADVMAGL